MTPEQIVEAARDKLRPVEMRTRCPPATNGEIVVCGEGQHTTGVPSSLDHSNTAVLAVPDG
jgi:hypothetical protein